MANNEATKGYRATCAFAKALAATPPAWGPTATLCASGSGIEIISSNINSDVQLVDRDDELSGSDQSRGGDKGTEVHKPQIVVPAKYETLAPLIALPMGVAAAPVQQGGTAAYKHALSRIIDPVGLMGTYVEDWQTEVHEYPSCKILGWDFEINSKDQRGKFTFAVAAHSMNRNTASGTNKTSTISSITMSANRSRVLFSQLVARMNDQSGGALSSSGGTLGIGDKQLLASLKISYRRPFVEDDFTTEFGYLISEPHANGKSQIGVTLGFSKYATDNIGRFADALAKTEKKMDLIFTGPLAAVGYNYSLAFYLNAVQFSGRPQIGGPGVAAWSIEGVAHEVPSIGTGMPTGYTQACHVDIVNTLSTNPLL